MAQEAAEFAASAAERRVDEEKQLRAAQSFGCVLRKAELHQQIASTRAERRRLARQDSRDDPASPSFAEQRANDDEA